MGFDYENLDGDLIQNLKIPKINPKLSNKH